MGRRSLTVCGRASQRLTIARGICFKIIERRIEQALDPGVEDRAVVRFIIQDNQVERTSCSFDRWH